MSRSRAALARCAVASWALASLTAAAWAAPDDPAPDPVRHFLAEHGLTAHSSAPTSIGPVPAAVGSETNALAVRVREKASEMVLTAMNFIGVSYRRGGESFARGFDCSGFTRHVFEMSLGLVLPRRADEQAKAKGLIKVPRNELEPGDLVFFNTLKRTFSHVGIYIGEGKFIHAPRPGSEVRVEDMRLAYWSKRFTGARRAESALEATAAPSLDAVSAPTPAAQ